MKDPNQTSINLVSPFTPGNLQISGADAEPIVTIHWSGRVEVNPKYTVDDAARAFWDAVIAMNPLWKKED